MVASIAHATTARLALAAIRTDGGTQVRARIDGDAVNDYARALPDLPPVEVCWDGAEYWLTDGFHRVAAHHQVGSLQVDALIREGTKRDAVLRACSANGGHGVRRTNHDKRNAVKVMLCDDEWSTWTDRAIAEHCAVSHPFVSQMRRALEGADGAGNGYHPQSRETDDDDDEPADEGDDGNVLDDADEPDEHRAVAKKSAATAAITSSSSNDWYTPSEFVEAAREVMGGIDLDPASSDVANEVVRATSIYTIDDDGLSQEWGGRVWLNPPYGRNDDNVSNQALWSERLLDDHADGRVEQACLMVTSKTADAWFQQLWDTPICFIAGRVQFRPGAGQDETTNTQGNVVAYLGARVEAFERAFERFGRIVVPTPFGAASLRSSHLRLCATCRTPCSSGRWCPTCKQHERKDRAWMRSAIQIAERELKVSRTPSPAKIAARVRIPWTDIVRLFVTKKVGTDEMRAAWQKQAQLARRGE